MIVEVRDMSIEMSACEYGDEIVNTEMRTHNHGEEGL